MTKAQGQHWTEVRDLAQHSANRSSIKKLTPKLPTRYSRNPYLRFALNTYANLFLSLIFNWTMPWTMPLNTLFLWTVFPFLVVLLLVIEVALKVFLEHLGGNALIEKWSRQYGGGLSPINWGYPDFFTSEEAVAIVKKTMTTLGAHREKSLPPANISQPSILDLSVAQTMLLFASVIYERKDNLVTQAYTGYLASLENYKGSPIDLTDGVQSLSPNEKEIQAFIEQSEEPIRRLVKHWDVEFEGITELKSLGGPFCGMFYSSEQNFIVITFKGTTPTNYGEFLVDATIQRTNAKPFVYGEIHEGFYNSLFPSSGTVGANDPRDPYGSILAAVISRARTIQASRNSAQAVNVWITGHSLGSALGTILFARWLKSPRDLDASCCLRDVYLFGTPAVGDYEFASTFASYSTIPYHTPNTLWRIIHNVDMIAYMPLGQDNPNIGRFLNSKSIFNFCHVGLSLWLSENGDRYKVSPSNMQPCIQTRVVMGAYTSKTPMNRVPRKDIVRGHESNGTVWTRAVERWFKRIQQRRKTEYNPITILESLYPLILMDHVPRTYWTALSCMRKQLEEGEWDDED